MRIASRWPTSLRHSSHRSIVRCQFWMAIINSCCISNFSSGIALDDTACAGAGTADGERGDGGEGGFGWDRYRSWVVRCVNIWSRSLLLRAFELASKTAFVVAHVRAGRRKGTLEKEQSTQHVYVAFGKTHRNLCRPLMGVSSKGMPPIRGSFRRC